MQPSDIGRILGIMAAIGLVVLIVVQIANFARNSSDSDSSSQNTDSGEVDNGPLNLRDFATDTSNVVMIRDGSVIAHEDHRRLKITISQKHRVIEVFSSYEGQLLTREVYKNTPAAYEAFLAALTYRGFEDKKDGRVGEDYTGFCSNGYNVELQLNDNREQIYRAWGSSCGSEFGTHDGQTRQARLLFQEQIPEFRDVVSGVRF